MPIVLNPNESNPYDLAALVSQISARNQQARQASAQIESGAYKGLADDIGGAAKNYTNAKLTQQQQEMQDRREREARQERRQIADESAFLSSQQHVQSALQSLEKEHSDLIKEGKAWEPETQATYMRERKSLQKLWADPNISQRDKASIAYTILNRASQNRPDLLAEGPLRAEDIENLPGKKLIRLPGGTKQIVDVSAKDDPRQKRLTTLQSQQKTWFDAWEKAKTPQQKAKASQLFDAVTNQVDALQQEIQGNTPSAPQPPPMPDQDFGAGFDPSTPQTYDEMLAAEMAADAGSSLQQPQAAPELLPQDEVSTPDEPETIPHGGYVWQRDGFDDYGKPKWKKLHKAPELEQKLAAEKDTKKERKDLQAFIDNLEVQIITADDPTKAAALKSLQKKKQDQLAALSPNAAPAGTAVVPPPVDAPTDRMTVPPPARGSYESLPSSAVSVPSPQPELGRAPLSGEASTDWARDSIPTQSQIDAANASLRSSKQQSPEPDVVEFTATKESKSQAATMRAALKNLEESPAIASALTINRRAAEPLLKDLKAAFSEKADVLDRGGRLTPRSQARIDHLLKKLTDINAPPPPERQMPEHYVPTFR